VKFCTAQDANNRNDTRTAQFSKLLLTAFKVFVDRCNSQINGSVDDLGYRAAIASMPCAV
jgi:hypothetical protein